MANVMSMLDFIEGRIKMETAPPLTKRRLGEIVASHDVEAINEVIAEMNAAGGYENLAE